MSQSLTKTQLSRALGVTPRTVERWVQRGCPSEGSGASRRFDPAEVRAWLQRQGISGRLGRPSHMDALPSSRGSVPAAGPAFSPPPVAAGFSRAPQESPGVAASKQNLAKAELARKISIVKKNELEVASEKSLAELGLDTKIREAKTYDDLLQLNKEVAALMASGAMLPSRGLAIQRTMAEARQNLQAKLEAPAEDDDGRLFLCTEESAEIAQVFDHIVSDERRQLIMDFVEQQAWEDLEETPELQPADIAD
ncbi:MAG: helix-turn-helix domain-containing protein [Planctomycetota bacterium]